MADRSTKRLARLHRVRTLQLGQVQAAESAAAAKRDSETQLRQRIDQLAANISPQREETGFATSLAAAAHYRDRLHVSAVAAGQRVHAAEAGLDRAREATREARRDQSAIEKLIGRAEADAALKALRALEEAPVIRRNRHAPC
jgi:flagellar FliJ protein